MSVGSSRTTSLSWGHGPVSSPMNSMSRQFWANVIGSGTGIPASAYLARFLNSLFTQA